MTGGDEVVDPSDQSASVEDDHIAAQATTKRDAQEGMDVLDEQVSAPELEDPSSPAHSGASTAVMSTELYTETGDPYSGTSSPDSPSKASSIVSPIANVEKSSEPMNEDPVSTGEVENTPEIEVDAMNVAKSSSQEFQDAEISQNVADVISSRTGVVEMISTTEVQTPSVTDGPEMSTYMDGATNNIERKEGEMRSQNLELEGQSEVLVAVTSSLEVEQAIAEKGVSESNEPQSLPSMAAELPEEPNRMNTSKQDSNGKEDDNVRRGNEDNHRIGITSPINQIQSDVARASDSSGPRNGNQMEQLDTSSSVHHNGLKEEVDEQDVTIERIRTAAEAEVRHETFVSSFEFGNEDLSEKGPKAPAQEVSGLMSMSGLATLSVAVEEMDEGGRELQARPEDSKEEVSALIATPAAIEVNVTTPASSSLTGVLAKTELEREMELFEASEKEEEARMLAHMRSDQLLAGESTGDSKDLLNERKRALESTPNEARKKRGKRVLSSENLSKDEEDVCFICFDGGDLVLCDRRTCPKAYHLTCIGRDTAFFEKKGAWICGWHFCTGCTKPANFQCYTCPTAYCSACLKKADFLCVRQRKGLCEECWPIVHMIENNETTNAEGVEVDFEDQETYECLFKDYWVDLKQRLQLTPAELDKDKQAAGSGGLYLENGESDAEDKGDVEDYNTGSDSGASGEGDDKMDTSDEAKKRKRGKAKASTIPASGDDAVMGADSEPYILPEEEDVMEDVEEDDVEEYTEEDGDQKSDVQLREGWASKELIDFVKFMDEDPKKPLTKFEVTKLLWAYIKSHKLQDPRKKTQILCDERLQTLFGKKTVNQYDMIKHVQSHYTLKGAKSRRPNMASDEVLKMDEDPNEDGVDDKYSKIRDVKDKRRRRKGDDDKFERPSVNEYAAITPKNINLIYLRRQLLEELLDDPEFDSKVCSTFVRIRVPGMVSKSEMCYRLVQVVGTRLQAEAYKAGRKTTNIVLEILNLQKREDVTVDLVSNHEFSEEECQRLRQSIKCGLIKTLTVGDIEDKAKDLQEAKVNDWFETERQRLVNLRDRASEKGRKKELRECVEKLQELNSPAFRAAKLHARPEVTADPRMDPNYESDGNEDKSKDKMMMMDGSATILERSPSAIGMGDKLATASNLKSSQLESGSRPEWDSARNKHSAWVENTRNREVERGGFESGRSGDKMAYGRVPSYSIEDTNERGYDERDRGWDKEWVMDERDTGVGTGWMGNGRNIRSAPAERWTEKVNNISAGIDGGRAGRSDYRGSTSLTGLTTPVYDGKADWNKPRELPTAPSMQSTFPLASQLTSTLSKAALEAAEKEKVWHYMDPTGTIQGPFSMEQLRKWNTTGYFPLDLRIWRTNQPRDESVLLTDALAGRVQKERIDSWGSATVRAVDIASQPALSVSALASGYNINKTSADGWRDNAGGSSSSWVDRGSSADVAGRSTTSWGVDNGSRLGRDIISVPAVRDSSSDLKWKAGPAETGSWDTYGVGRSNNSYGTSPTRNSRAEAAARFDPANWGSRSDTVRTSEKDSWTSPSPGADGGYSKPGGGGGRSSWGRGSSHNFRDSGGSWNSFNEDSGGGHDNSRPMKTSRGSKKDVPCRFHQKGWCKRGDSCDFWHG